jgi:hypothetical protein
MDDREREQRVAQMIEDIIHFIMERIKVGDYVSYFAITAQVSAHFCRN